MTEQNTSFTAQDAAPPAASRGGRVTLFGIKLGWGSLTALILLLGLLLVVALAMMRNKQGPVSVGEPVPDFALTTFTGEQINLSGLRGKVVVVNFWASWCKPCEQEAADLETAWRSYQERGDVVFLGVDYVDTEPKALAYLEKFSITYPNGPDLGTRISQAFRIKGVPETYVIDQQGKLAFTQIGPFTSLAHVKSVIDPLLQP